MAKHRVKIDYSRAPSNLYCTCLYICIHKHAKKFRQFPELELSGHVCQRRLVRAQIHFISQRATLYLRSERCQNLYTSPMRSLCRAPVLGSRTGQEPLNYARARLDAVVYIHTCERVHREGGRHHSPMPEGFLRDASLWKELFRKKNGQGYGAGGYFGCGWMMSADVDDKEGKCGVGA